MEVGCDELYSSYLTGYGRSERNEIKGMKKKLLKSVIFIFLNK